MIKDKRERNKREKGIDEEEQIGRQTRESEEKVRQGGEKGETQEERK